MTHRGLSLSQDGDAEHMHDSTVTSVSIVAEGLLHPQRIERWLRDLLSEHGADIFRSKGVLSLAGCDEKCAHLILMLTEAHLWLQRMRAAFACRACSAICDAAFGQCRYRRQELLYSHPFGSFNTSIMCASTMLQSPR